MVWGLGVSLSDTGYFCLQMSMNTGECVSSQGSVWPAGSLCVLGLKSVCDLMHKWPYGSRVCASRYILCDHACPPHLSVLKDGEHVPGTPVLLNPRPFPRPSGQGRWPKAGVCKDSPLSLVTEILCRQTQDWKAASSEGPLGLVPSPALCCHQGHLLRLTDRREKPIKRLPLPVICYRRGRQPH
jgi:hypothetical protein